MSAFVLLMVFIWERMWPQQHWQAYPRYGFLQFINFWPKHLDNLGGFAIKAFAIPLLLGTILVMLSEPLGFVLEMLLLLILLENPHPEGYLRFFSQSRALEVLMQRSGILFGFVCAGAGGALVYYLIYQLAKQNNLPNDLVFRANQVAHWMYYPPVIISSLLFAVVGSFAKTKHCWQNTPRGQSHHTTLSMHAQAALSRADSLYPTEAFTALMQRAHLAWAVIVMILV